MVLIISFSESALAKTKGYKFKYNGSSVTVDQKAKSFIKSAGKPIKKKTTKSCAFKGKDRKYTYNDFILTTYSKKNKGAEYVLSISLRNGNVSTKEGIKIGSSEEDVVKKYGKKYDSVSLNVNNMYVYKKGTCKLKIAVKNSKVVAIAYESAAHNY